jgi:hypothetical protein
MNSILLVDAEYVFGLVFEPLAIILVFGTAFLVLRLLIRANFPSKKNRKLALTLPVILSGLLLTSCQKDAVTPSAPTAATTKQDYMLPEVEIVGTNFGAGEYGIPNMERPHYRMDPNGGGGGGGFGGSERTYTPIPYTEAEVENFDPILGNYGTTLRIKDMTWQVIEARVEVDTNNHLIQSLTLSLGGVTYLTKLTQNGVGVQTSYNAQTDTYYFNISFTKTYLDGLSNTRTIYGRMSPRTNSGALYFK